MNLNWQRPTNIEETDKTIDIDLHLAFRKHNQVR